MSAPNPNPSAGTQVVSLIEIRGPNNSLVHPRGAVGILRECRMPVCIEAHRYRLHSVKRGELEWREADAWRQELHRDFEHALAETKLPERPDYEAANHFLIKVRREMAHH